MNKRIDPVSGPRSPHKRRYGFRFCTAILCAVLLLSVLSGCAGQKNNTPSGSPDVHATHYAEIVVKDYGTITVALDRSIAPETVDNFVSLAQSVFYNGLTFHRIMSGFMIQGGDPNGDGTGGSEKTIKGEFRANGFENNLKHTRGVISMARKSKPYDSASSQFFIMHTDYPSLDGLYAAFGCVTEGMEVVDKICADAKPVDNNGTIPAAQQPVIVSVTIREAK